MAVTMTYTTSEQAQAHLKIALETRSWNAVRAALATLDGSIGTPADSEGRAGITRARRANIGYTK